MSYRLACEASDIFTAVASVTGSMVPSALDQCDPERIMPVMQIHGTNDPTVNYNGSNIGAGIEDVVNFWASANNCNLTPEVIPVEDINTADQCTAERIVYSECDDNKEVILYKIEGGAHTWPDAALTLGTTNRDFNANQEIWNFFNRYDLNGTLVLSTDDGEPGGNLALSPNPAADIVSLTNLSIDVKTITIVNTVGQVVMHINTVQENSMEIDISSLDVGVYFLTVGRNSGRECVKLVKK